jgi:hypothetical protein
MSEAMHREYSGDGYPMTPLKTPSKLLLIILPKVASAYGSGVFAGQEARKKHPAG